MNSPPTTKLSDKHRLFCELFLALQNPKEAALLAGFKPSNRCEKIGYSLLGSPSIVSYLSSLQAKPSFQFSPKNGLARIAFGSLSDSVRLLFSDNISQNLDSIDNLDLFCVSEIKRDKNGALELKFYDRLKAIDRLLELENDASSNPKNSFFSALENTVTKS